MLRALLWDVDGTLAESERDGHRVAFNAAFGSLGLAGLAQAITTTTSRSNVDALSARHFGLRASRRLFCAWVCGEDVAAKKPHPKVYLRALGTLNLPALACLAIEVSPGGVAATRAADAPVLVTRSACFADDTVEGAFAIGPGLHQRRGWVPALADEADGSSSDAGGLKVLRWRATSDPG